MTHSLGLSPPHPPLLQEAPRFPGSRLEQRREGAPSFLHRPRVPCPKVTMGRGYQPSHLHLQRPWEGGGPSHLRFTPTLPRASRQGSIASDIESSHWHLLSVCVIGGTEHAQ